VQLAPELLVGPVAGLAIALLWVWDLRKQNAELRERLNRFLDKIEVAPRDSPK